MRPPQLLQDPNVRHGWHQKTHNVRGACFGWHGRRDTEKVQPRQLLEEPDLRHGREQKAEMCAKHALEGMVDVVNKRCGHPSCSKLPSFSMAGTKRRVMCAEHALDGMVSVKRCCHPYCSKRPHFDTSGNMKAGMCLEHAKAGRNYPSRNQRSRCEQENGSGCGIESVTDSGGRRRERDPPTSGTAVGLRTGTSKRGRKPGSSPDVPIVVEDAAAEGTTTKVQLFVFFAVYFACNRVVFVPSHVSKLLCVFTVGVDSSS